MDGSSGNLKSLSPIFFDSAEKVAQAWNGLIDSAEGDSDVIDVQRWANHISLVHSKHFAVSILKLSWLRLDTIGLAGFGFDFETLNPSKPRHPLARTLDGLTDSSGTHSFSAFLVHAFLWAFPAILRIPSDRQKALSKSRQTLSKITDQLWTERKKAGLDGQDNGKSILELLLQAENQSNGSSSLTKEQIAAEVILILLKHGNTTHRDAPDDDFDLWWLRDDSDGHRLGAARTCHASRRSESSSRGVIGI